MILVVGLSPAWQRTLEFAGWRTGEVNRARRVTETASGKGVNVARVAATLGAKVCLLTVAGGERGKLLEKSLAGEKFQSRVIRVSAETRICQTLLGTGTATELVEEVGALTAREVGCVVREFEKLIRRARLVVLSGTVPPGCGEDFYARLIRRSKAPVMVDAQGRQLRNAIAARPLVVKVNRDEFVAARGAEWMVITDGARRVRAVHGREKFSFLPPRVKAVNPIGSGDAMLAGMAWALSRGLAPVAAVRFGVACGAANALTPTAGVVRKADVSRLLKRVC